MRQLHINWDVLIVLRVKLNCTRHPCFDRSHGTISKLSSHTLRYYYRVEKIVIWYCEF